MRRDFEKPKEIKRYKTITFKPLLDQEVVVMLRHYEIARGKLTFESEYNIVLVDAELETKYGIYKTSKMVLFKANVLAVLEPPVEVKLVEESKQ